MNETNMQYGGRPSLPMQGVPQPKRDEVLGLPRVHISTHPVMAHKMTALRDKNTQPPEFYRLVKEIGALLAYEATASLALEPLPIETPMQPMLGQRLAGAVATVKAIPSALDLGACEANAKRRGRYSRATTWLPVSTPLAFRMSSKESRSAVNFSMRSRVEPMD